VLQLKVTEFLGRRVVDKKAMEIGKVSDLVIEPKEAVITGIQISTSDFGLRRNDLFITPAEIEEIGDYILLNISKEELTGVEEAEQKNQEASSLKL